jgi:hypothetical protein
VAGAVFVGLSVFVLGFVVANGYDYVSVLLLFGVIGAIELTIALLVPLVYHRTRQGVEVRRGDEDRRRLAERMQWSFQESDPTLVDCLGSMETRLVGPVPLGPRIVLGGRELTPVHREIEAAGPARAILRGNAGGVPVTVFDFSRMKDSANLRTAWVVELPADLPYLGMPLAFCPDGWTRPPVPPKDSPEALLSGSLGAVFDGLYGGGAALANPSYYTESPDFAREVLTPEVRALTTRRFPSWWIDGRHLISVEGGPAPADLVVRNVELIAALAGLLPRDALTRWAQPTQPPGARSRAWLARSREASRPAPQA